MTASRWAILLCKFSDDTTSTVPLEHYQRLFTGVGAGSLNMVDFFREMSHGQLDLSGSQVFGWFTLSITKAQYSGSATPHYDRNGLVALCRQAATDGGVNLASFDGVVVSMNGAVDLFGYVGGMTAFCDSLSLSPSPLGQEMGHGYGLDHARKDGSTADYQDPWDVMSVYDSYMASNSEWGSVGPGLNAWCMRSRGWLDETRVWSHNAMSSYSSVIQLRPLHRHDLPGYLAANFGEYLIEYRPQQRWDAAFPRSAVFVHRFDDNHSYVMPGVGGNYDLVAGDAFEVGIVTDPYEDYLRAEVTSIDDANLTATIGLFHRTRIPFPKYEVGGILVGGVAVDGPGGIIINGVYHPIPPRGPDTLLLARLAEYLAVRDITDVNLRRQAQRSALAAVNKLIVTQLNQLSPLRSPSPLKGRTVGKEQELR